MQAWFHNICDSQPEADGYSKDTWILQVLQPELSILHLSSTLVNSMYTKAMPETVSRNFRQHYRCDRQGKHGSTDSSHTQH